MNEFEDFGKENEPARTETGRWVAVSVSMLDHPTLGGRYDRRSAWLWLIAHAAWKPHRARLGKSNKMVDLERGQVIASREFLAETWGWSENEVRGYVALLSQEGMLKVNRFSGRLPNIITICNFDKYQQGETGEAPVSKPVLNRLKTGKPPHSTKNTNIQNKKYTRVRLKKFPTRKPVEAAPAPVVSDDVEIASDGSISLPPRLQAFWLGEFGGDEALLRLSLIRARAFVQRNSSRPLEAQVGAQLAMYLGEQRRRNASDAARTMNGPVFAKAGKATADAAKREHSRQINERLAAKYQQQGAV